MRRVLAEIPLLGTFHNRREQSTRKSVAREKPVLAGDRPFPSAAFTIPVQRAAWTPMGVPSGISLQDRVRRAPLAKQEPHTGTRMSREGYHMFYSMPFLQEQMLFQKNMSLTLTEEEPRTGRVSKDPAARAGSVSAL